MKVSAFCIVCAAFRRCVNRGGCFHAKQNKECSYHTFQLRRKSKQFLEYDTGRRESVLIQENSIEALEFITKTLKKEVKRNSIENY